MIFRQYGTLPVIDVSAKAVRSGVVIQEANDNASLTITTPVGDVLPNKD